MHGATKTSAVAIAVIVSVKGCGCRLAHGDGFSVLLSFTAPNNMLYLLLYTTCFIVFDALYLVTTNQHICKALGSQRVQILSLFVSIQRAAFAPGTLTTNVDSCPSLCAQKRPCLGFCSTHAFLHSFAPALTHPLMHSLNHSCTHSLTHPPTHPLSQSLTLSLTHSCAHSLTHPPTHSNMESGTYMPM